MKAKRIFVGIDPGVHSGIAVYDGEKLTDVKTVNFWDLIMLIDIYAVYAANEQIKITFVVENPNYNRPTFFRENAKNFRAMNKLSQNVGSNKRDAQLIIQYIGKIPEAELIEVKPSTQKWDKQTFQNITKWTEETSQHGRDAAKLIFGR